MTDDRILSKTEIVGIEDLQTDFLSLRVGEVIPRLEIKEIRKIANKAKQDNLSGVDYKYIIQSQDNKILTVNSWVLWKKIASILHGAGKINVALELKHNGVEDYSIRVI